jgi:hypothetical protein
LALNIDLAWTGKANKVDHDLWKDKNIDPGLYTTDSKLITLHFAIALKAFRKHTHTHKITYILFSPAPFRSGP